MPCLDRHIYSLRVGVAVTGRYTRSFPKTEALPWSFWCKRGGAGRKRWSKGAARPFFGPKWGRRPKKANRRRSQALFRSKVGGTAEKCQSEALPGRISVQSGGNGRKRGNLRRSLAVFSSKEGGTAEKGQIMVLPTLPGKSRANHGQIMGKLWANSLPITPPNTH